MGSGGGGSAPANTTNVQTIQYAPYIEDYHRSLLAKYWEYADRRDINPFDESEALDADTIFFGLGKTLSSFESLFGLFGRYMSGIDVSSLWTNTLDNTINSAAVRELVHAESVLMDDEIESSSLPRLQIGMRDINSIVSSSFAIGKALIEDTKVKVMNKFSAELNYKLISTATDRWRTTLEWNKGVVGVYAEMIKFYYSAKMDVVNHNEALLAKKALWPFTVLEFLRSAIGTLQGATTSKTDVAGASTGSKLLGNALSGAAMGAMIGGSIGNTAQVTNAAGQVTQAPSYMGSYVGAGIGAILGIAASYTY